MRRKTQPQLPEHAQICAGCLRPFSGIQTKYRAYERRDTDIPRVRAWVAVEVCRECYDKAKD